MSSVYGRRFTRLLKEDLDNIDPKAEKGAMTGMLDDDTPPDAFQTDQPAQDLNADVQKAISEREQQMISLLQGWISEMEQFRNYLNGPDDQSIQMHLANAEPETILDKMRNAEQRKIARVATELAALIESFKGYVAQSGNSNLKYV
jgi:5'-deoxynucleotidase YfbR-like HD superfamily hydrolase